MTDLKKENKELRSELDQLRLEMARFRDDLIHDGLTRLTTRQYFMEKAVEEVSLLSKIVNENQVNVGLGFENISFLFCDIDYFKKVNDTFGHDVGDEVLKVVSDILKSRVRDFDTVSRWGGEEIVVSLVRVSVAEATRKAEDLRMAVQTITKETFAKKYPKLNVTISIGVTAYRDGVTLDELVDQADQALCEAKDAGRNKVVVYIKKPVKKVVKNKK